MNNIAEALRDAIYLYNDRSDNAEYLRGQLELALHLMETNYDDAATVAYLTSGLEK